jgi:hypothetical protein
LKAKDWSQCALWLILSKSVVISSQHLNIGKMPAFQSQKYDVFLSHNSVDKQQVETLAARLEDEEELKPFLDKWHLVPGEPWQEAIEEALDQSRTCAVFLGMSGLGPWEHEEMRAALDERIRDSSFRVIPVLLPKAELKDGAKLPRFLRRLTWVDFRTGIDDHEAFSHLVAGIRGVPPGRNHRIQKEVVQWELKLTGTIDDIKPVMEAITAHLCELSGDVHLTILKIEQGSVRLFIESSQEGFEQIKTLFRQGQLRDVLGIQVLEITPIYSDEQRGHFRRGAGMLVWLISIVRRITRRKAPPELEVETDQLTTAVTQQARDNVIQIGGSVSGSSIQITTAGVSEQQFSRAQSDFFNNEGRIRVRAFGERMAQEGVWDWWPLGQAIEYYVESIKHDPQNQHPWINLAYVYHLIGKRQKVLECINKALELAMPGPNYPGNHYKLVREAIDTGSYLSGGKVERPSIPDWFRKNWGQYL